METTSAGTAMQQQQQTILINKNETKKMKVMVAIDESDVSFYALKWAVDHLFVSTGVAPETSLEEVGMLVVVHVQQPFHHFAFPAGPGGATAFYATTSVVESVRKAQEENSAMLLSRALQLCKDKMIKAETLILDGDPKDMICQAAEQMHADLLVVGSRGLGKIKRAFLGSVSDYCAHHAKCPILIVRPPKESHEGHGQ
ncbi:universal stress protein YxiE isoform X2 [Fagus crenata]